MEISIYSSFINYNVCKYYKKVVFYMLNIKYTNAKYLNIIPQFLQLDLVLTLKL